MSSELAAPPLPLSAAATFVNGDRSTNYPKQDDYVENGIPFISASDLTDGRIEQASVKRIKDAAFARLRSGKIEPNDILFCLRGSIGKMAFVGRGERGAIASSLVIVRPKPCADPHYLYFFLCSSAGQHAALSLNNGSAQPNLSVSQLQRICLPLPPIATQRAIAAVLASLTDRINLLRETNATLEAIAQALFKSWFVDFDPVRAKQQGLAPTGMDEATAALFPEGFEEPASGLIPKGWATRSVYEIASVIYGAPFASSRFNTNRQGRPLIRIRDLKDEAPGVHTMEAHPKGYVVQAGDIVVGMDGEFRAYLWGGEEAWLNQRVCVFAPKDNIPAAFVRSTVEPLLAQVEATETATTVIHLGKNDIDRFRAVVPDPAVLQAFADVANPIYARVVSAKQAARTLTTLRDNLLPRLISGRLRLPEAEAVIEQATA